MKFLEEVAEEHSRAIAKFPNPDCNLAALTEELGELAQAMLQYYRDGTKSWGDFYGEAVQVAAMAMRCALEGDPTLARKESPESKELQRKYWGPHVTFRD